jgi:hypothetical protein
MALPCRLTNFTIRAMRPLGVLAYKDVCLRIAATPWSAAIAQHSNSAFFLHATHVPLIVVVKLVHRHLLPSETDAWLLAHYATSAAVTLLRSF